MKLTGGDLKAVQGDSGQSGLKMIEDVYSHILDEDRVRTAQIREEELEKLHSCLDALIGKQRFILTECVVNGRMQLDVANRSRTLKDSMRCDRMNSLI